MGSGCQLPGLGFEVYDCSDLRLTLGDISSMGFIGASGWFLRSTWGLGFKAVHPKPLWAPCFTREMGVGDW